MQNKKSFKEETVKLSDEIGVKTVATKLGKTYYLEFPQTVFQRYVNLTKVPICRFLKGVSG